MSDVWQEQMVALGSFIRNQRKLSNLSLRRLSALTTLSNPCLSQLERGRHQPSVRVLKLIADALQVSTEELLTRTGLASDDDQAGTTSVEAAIEADERLSPEQKKALVGVYRAILDS